MPAAGTAPVPRSACSSTPAGELLPFHNQVVAPFLRDRADFRPLSELLPPNLLNCSNHGEIAVPKYAFAPGDGWTAAFLEGLTKCDLNGKGVIEVGIGTGINAITLLRSFPGIRRFWGSDLEENVAALARRNVLRAFANDVDSPHVKKFEIIRGGHSLLAWCAGRIQRGEADVVIACIPQVKLPEGIDTATLGADFHAHYYRLDPDQAPSRFDIFNLGLNHALLCQARDILNPGGKVILNLGGRPGISHLTDLFDEAGFDPKVVHEKIVPQHPGTCLKSLVSDEARLQAQHSMAAFQFELFADKDATKPISAKVAHALMQKHQPVFHKIYVIEGTLR